MTLSNRFGRFGPALLLLLVILVLAACVPAASQSLAPGVTPSPSPLATLPQAAIALEPAKPTGVFEVLAWLFTPVFQVFFITLVLLDRVTGNIAVAIILMTLLIKIALIPIFRRQIVSTRRMQLSAKPRQ